MTQSKAAVKKPAKKTRAKKVTVRNLKSICAKLPTDYGKKIDGTLKKGFRYKDSKVVKVAAKKPTTAKKITKTKRTTKTKKSGLFGLGLLGIL